MGVTPRFGGICLCVGTPAIRASHRSGCRQRLIRRRCCLVQPRRRGRLVHPRRRGRLVARRGGRLVPPRRRGRLVWPNGLGRQQWRLVLRLVLRLGPCRRGRRGHRRRVCRSRWLPPPHPPQPALAPAPAHPLQQPQPPLPLAPSSSPSPPPLPSTLRHQVQHDETQT